ncbi:DUF308 domain-containing protein [Mycobacterium sp. IDR2000157661]|uniref:DUF308 domain-containing protein n=1 Tax=Mycobacterium sp. IDR2000157661 TaxID=2867005 RepID=UPI001EEC6ACB|nr:DUF308 domain-containing protein [Mycobacterium sp. IDR2000157661]ULE32140.1 DUF308 domain-containing protein [Mycobacterium sp. IDR2000157661]
MLIVALVLAVIGLAALVTAVVTSNELIAWVCIGASVIGVLLLIVDAVRERSAGRRGGDTAAEADVQADAEPQYYEDYPEDDATVAAESNDEAETSVVEQAREDSPDPAPEDSRDDVSGEERSR